MKRHINHHEKINLNHIHHFNTIHLQRAGDKPEQ
jgi:hypothetical protein